MDGGVKDAIVNQKHREEAQKEATKPVLNCGLVYQDLTLYLCKKAHQNGNFDSKSKPQKNHNTRKKCHI
jgi:hypothetical protein